MTELGNFSIDNNNKTITITPVLKTFVPFTTDDITEGENNLFLTPQEKLNLTVSLPVNQIAFGSANNTISSSNKFLWNDTGRNVLMPTFGNSVFRFGGLWSNVPNWTGWFQNMRFDGTYWYKDDISLWSGWLKFDVRNSVYGNEIGFAALAPQSNPIPDSQIKSRLRIKLDTGNIGILEDYFVTIDAKFFIVNNSATQPIVKLKSANNQSSDIIQIFDFGNTKKAYLDNNYIFYDVNGQVENRSNKENTTLDDSTTKYPTNNLVKTYVDTKKTFSVAYDDLLGIAQLGNRNNSLGTIQLRDSGFYIEAFLNNSLDISLMSYQFSHMKKLGTNAGSYHAHIYLPNKPNAGDTVIFDYSYIWINPIGNIPALANWISGTKTHVFSGSENQYDTLIISIIDSLNYPTNEAYSSMLFCKVSRKASGTGRDTYNSDLGVFFFDLHYQKDRFGSTLEFTD